MEEIRDLASKLIILLIGILLIGVVMSSMKENIVAGVNVNFFISLTVIFAMLWLLKGVLT